MTYNQALMIVRNATAGYSRQQIRDAVVFVLGSVEATEDDCLDAGAALGYADQMGVSASYAPGARCGDVDDHPFSGAISAGDY